MASRTKHFNLLWAGLLLLAALALKGLLVQAPPLPSTVEASDFDHRRALDRLGRILGDQRPHSVDSPANDEVRDRLIAELSAIGLAPQVREASDCSGFPDSRAVSCSHVRNVVAILSGPEQPALLLNAHYDSTPTGPGAADDGAGVAALIEIAAIMKDRPRRRPIIFLFNEGEEYGLNGAAVFAERDPLADRVGSLINIEARGVTGPALMFETSLPNGRAVADFAASARKPYANSASADVAKFIPNSTDVVKFRPRGWQILNFAITGNETRYHSPGDDLAHLDPASFRHLGIEALAVAERMAGPDRPDGASTLIYTDVAGLFLLRLPALLGFAWLGVLLIGGLALAHRNRAWPSLARLAVALLASIAAAALAATIVAMLRPGDYWRAYPFVPTLAVAATLVAVQAPLLSWAAGRADRSRLRIAAWLLILLIGGALGALMPGAVIFFLVAPTLGLLGHRWRPLAWLGALVQLVMLGEIVQLLEMTLIDGPAWSVAPAIALIALPLLVEAGRGTRVAMLAFAGFAAALWAACLLIPRSSADRPLAMTIDHVRDDRSGSAQWALASKQAPLPAGLDRFGPWDKDRLPYNQRTRWMAEAPLLDGPRDGLEVVTQWVGDGRRRVRFRLDRGGADAILIRFEKEVPVLAMGLPGSLRRLDPEPDASVLRCTGRRCDGLAVDVLLGTDQPVEALVVAQRFAPPAEAGPLIESRPADAHPQYSPDSQVRVRAVQF